MKIDLQSFKGVIFDMDGTMIDNMLIHHQAWQKKLSELGMELNLQEVKESIHGVNEEILTRLFGDRLSKVERKFHADDKEAQYRLLYKDSLKLIDGLDEFLQFLKEKKIKIGIGTAAPKENVDFVLDTLSIRPLFGAVVDAGMVEKGKPNPEIFLKTIHQLGLLPEECIIFEDSPTGVEAAVRSGATVIVVTTTHQPNEFKKFPVHGFIKDFLGCGNLFKF